MKHTRILTVLPLLGTLVLGACQDGQPTDPFTPADDLAVTESVTLDVTSSSTALDVAHVMEGLRRRQGDTLGARNGGTMGGRNGGTLGGGATNQRRRGGGDDLSYLGADVRVALGATAVALATRILEEQGADDEQARFLDAAVEYQRAAEAALDAGDPGRASHYANLAQVTALKAVVLPGGVTDEEARAMLELAQAEYAAASSGELDEVEAALLERARLLIDHGTAALEGGSVRGVGAFWRAAVICSWISG